MKEHFAEADTGEGDVPLKRAQEETGDGFLANDMLALICLTLHS